MSNSIFGWSYPPGCSGTPFDEPEAPIDLRDDRTLKGYGRRQHGLNGKDADLDSSGQNHIKSALWFDGERIEIEGHRYASVCHGEHWDDDLMDQATEIVCGCDYPGEYDGDYWVLGEDYSLSVPFAWTDDLDEAGNIKAACQAAFEAIDKDSAAFEEAMRDTNRAIERLPADRRIYRKLTSLEE